MTEQSGTSLQRWNSVNPLLVNATAFVAVAAINTSENNVLSHNMLGVITYHIYLPCVKFILPM